MVSERWIIVAREVGIYDGIYYCKAFAAKLAEVLKDKCPGLDWEVEPTDVGSPEPGLIHRGRVNAAKILKPHGRMLRGDLLEKGFDSNYVDMASGEHSERY